jgi:hypothetical protein
MRNIEQRVSALEGLRLDGPLAPGGVLDELLRKSGSSLEAEIETCGGEHPFLRALLAEIEKAVAVQASKPPKGQDAKH